MLVLVKHDTAATSLYLHWHNLRCEPALFDGLNCAPLTLQREGVLRLPADPEFFRDIFGGNAHVACTERIGQCACHHVNKLCIAHPGAPTRTRDGIKSARHCLDPAAYGHLGLSELNSIRGCHDRLKPGATKPVQCECRRSCRHSRLQCRDARHIHIPSLAVDHIAHYQCFRKVRCKPGSLQRSPHDNSAKLACRNIL
ncbi:hypothetical protein CBM2637_B120043 [Cupriavidus taiwanensis]|nr:hypothetical protein CBM2637_B120043 [Cupriavidus taiwanensis]